MRVILICPTCDSGERPGLTRKLPSLLVFRKSAKLDCMEIRVLNEKDAATYWNLRHRSLQEEPFAFGKAAEEYEAIPIEAMVARLRDMAPDFTLGAFEQGEMIGMATYIR